MKDSMRSKLVGLCRRLEEIDAMLAAPDAADDMNRFRALSQERAEIEPVTVKMHAYEQTEGDIEAAQEMANEDPSFSDAAQEEIKACKAKLEALEKDLEVLLLPKDPNDSRNIFWKSVRAPVVTNPRFLPGTFCVCTCATPNVRAGGLRLSVKTKAIWAATRK